MGLKCQICDENFNSKDRLPLNLTCGHAFCQQCIATLFKEDKVCYSCETKISVKSIDDIPVSISLIDLCDVPDSIIYPERISYKDLEIESEDTGGNCLRHDKIPRHIWCSFCQVWICPIRAYIDHKEPPFGTCKLLTGKLALEDIKLGHITPYGKNIDHLNKLGNELNAVRGFLVKSEKELTFLAKQIKEKIDRIDNKKEEIFKIGKELKDNIETMKSFDTYDLIKKHTDMFEMCEREMINFERIDHIYRELVSIFKICIYWSRTENSRFGSK